MAEKIAPTIEAEEEVPEVKPENNEQMSEEAQLLETLKAASISKKEQLDGAIRNASKTFQMQSERDKLANELAQIRQQMAESEKRERHTEPQYDEYGQGQPVDLEGMLEKVLDRRETKKAQQQAAIQERQMKAWNTIQSDADFKRIESIWNEKLKDPNFVYGVQTGQIDPVLEYHEIKSEYFKGLMRQAVGTIETLQKGGAPQVHIESGEARTPSMDIEGEESEHEKIIKELSDKANSGQILSEDEELRLIQASLSKP